MDNKNNDENDFRNQDANGGAIRGFLRSIFRRAASSSIGSMPHTKVIAQTTDRLSDLFEFRDQIKSVVESMENTYEKGFNMDKIYASTTILLKAIPGFIKNSITGSILFSLYETYTTPHKMILPSHPLTNTVIVGMCGGFIHGSTVILWDTSATYINIIKNTIQSSQIINTPTSSINKKTIHTLKQYIENIRFILQQIRLRQLYSSVVHNSIPRLVLPFSIYGTLSSHTLIHSFLFTSYEICKEYGDINSIYEYISTKKKYYTNVQINDDNNNGINGDSSSKYSDKVSQNIDISKSYWYDLFYIWIQSLRNIESNLETDHQNDKYKKESTPITQQNLQQNLNKHEYQDSNYTFILKELSSSIIATTDTSSSSSSSETIDVMSSTTLSYKAISTFLTITIAGSLSGLLTEYLTYYTAPMEIHGIQQGIQIASTSTPPLIRRLLTSMIPSAIGFIAYEYGKDALQ